MKSLFTLVLIILFAAAIQAQNNIGINTTTPDASAALDVSSSNQGVLVPRMNQSQREAISNPATGLLVWQIDGTAGFYFNSGSPATPNWIQLGAKGDTGTPGMQGIQGQQGPAGAGLPTGGTAGQILSKVDAGNFNTAWTTPSGADNLGNHTATQNLNMNGNSITGATGITATGTATLGGNTYPTTKGTNGQMLKTDGAGALSWGSSGGASLQLSVTKTVAITTTVGSSLTLPDVVNFESGNAANASLTGGNTWTNNNKFTVGENGSGFYLIDIELVSNIVYAAPMIDMNNSGNSGSSFYGIGLTNSTTFQQPHKARGQLQKLVYLSIGDSFQIRASPGSAVQGADLSADGTTFIRIAKLN